MRIKLALVTIIVVLIIGSIGNTGINSQISVEDQEMRYQLAERVLHDPIFINGNEELLWQKGENNWTGSGEPLDPIEIADYRIEFADNGITIKNVDLHFAIVNCESHDYETGLTFSTGIKLINCTNGLISYSEAHMKETGIFIDESSHIRIEHTTVHNSATGITVSRSKYIQVDENNFSWNDWVGINVTLSDQCSLRNNSILSVPHRGIQCFLDRSTSILGNIVMSIGLDEEMFDNVGIYSLESWNIAINDNVVNECGIALEMTMTNGSWVWENEFSNTTEYSVYLGEGTLNITVVDNFIGPTQGTNAFDGGEANHWDDEYLEIGNWWSDYTGSGYYYISGPAGSIDHYPFGFTPGDNNTNPIGGDGDIPPFILATTIASSIVIVIAVMAILRSNRP